MITSRVRTLRTAAGLSQAELAQAADITRQAVISIETGRYVPNTAVALKIAQRLRCRVEELFALPEVDERAAVEVWETGTRRGSRVTLARVRGKLIAHALPPGRALFEGFASADAVMAEATDRRQRGSARLLVPEAQLDRTAAVLGCDPSLEIVSSHLARRVPGHRLACVPATSRAALDALPAGATHVAGSHLGENNVAQARRALAGTGGLVVALAAWEQGLMVAAGNRKKIRGVADLARRDVRFVNREKGAGIRDQLDRALADAGVPASTIAGYERTAPGHLASAHAVACNGADVALGIRAAAVALGLDFVPLSHVRFDLVIPTDHVSHAVVSAMLDLLNGRSLRADLATLPGYDVSSTGSVIAEIPSRARGAS